jgi:hypothetical protein
MTALLIFSWIVLLIVSYQGAIIMLKKTDSL